MNFFFFNTCGSKRLKSGIHFFNFIFYFSGFQLIPHLKLITKCWFLTKGRGGGGCGGEILGKKKRFFLTYLSIICRTHNICTFNTRQANKWMCFWLMNFSLRSCVCMILEEFQKSGVRLFLVLILRNF